MPINSEAQRRAMYAAAAGKSTLGIPKKVGEEFVAAGTSIPKPKKQPFGSFGKQPKIRIGHKSY